MRRRKQQAHPQLIGEVLYPLLKKRGMVSKFEEKALLKIWPKIVGPQIASQTQIDSFRHGMLFVKTVSSVWVQQLHFVKEEILRKLNELSAKPQIKEIRFIVGHTNLQQKEQGNTSHSRKPVLKKRDREMIAECTDSLADQELAAVLKRVMQLEISRRRRLENGKVR
jgi:predicted nucleic acid-binding Zn ribbon protein